MERIILLLFILFSVSGHARGYHGDWTSELNLTQMGGEAHGGDPLRDRFYEAKIEAVKKLEKIKRCSFSDEHDQRVVREILDKKQWLIEDLKGSKLTWVVDKMPTCGFTFDHKKSTIFLSYPTCRASNITPDEAMRLLIHESLHHLGYGLDDEEQVDEMVYAISRAVEVDSCPVLVENPFEESHCQGSEITENQIVNRFEKGTSKTKAFGDYKLFKRTRDCNSLTGCSDWIDDTPPTLLKNNPRTQKLQKTFWFNIDRKLKFSILEAHNHTYNLVFEDINYNIKEKKYVKTYHPECKIEIGKIMTCDHFMGLYVDRNNRTKLYFAGPKSIKVTNECLRLKSNYGTVPNDEGNYKEIETLVLGDLTSN